MDMNKLIHGGVVVDINSRSTKESSQHHNITRSLPKMDLCDEKFRNYHKQSNGA